MKYKSGLYFIAVLFVFLTCCYNIKEVPLPPGVKENYRSDEVKSHLFKRPRLIFFGYQVYYDSMLTSHSTDSTITFGIIFPWSSVSTQQFRRVMVFGNDSSKCTVDYSYFEQIENTAHSSLLFSLFSKNANSNNSTPDASFIYSLKRGIINCPLSKNEISFEYLDHKDAQKTRGYLLIGKDSFLIKPVIGKDYLSMKIVTGIQLMKADTLYAVLQKHPDKIHARDKIYLYTKTSEAEQFIISAYFAVIESL